MIIIKQHK